WCPQVKRDRVPILRVTRREIAIRAFAARAERGIEKPPERIDDTEARPPPPVMEQPAGGDLGDVSLRVASLEPHRQIWHDAKRVVDLEERSIEQLMDLLRRFVQSDAWVEVRRPVGRRDDDRAV